MKRTAPFTFLLMLLTLTAVAQDLPRKSPKASVAQRIGLTEVSVEYARPSVQGRTIWGELVAYGELWRTGANAATVIEFEDAAFIEGNLVPAGKYALFTIPGKDEFKVILNTEWDQWGAYNRDPELDLLSFSVPTKQTAKTEFLTFAFEDLAYDNAHLCMAWDELKVCMEIKTRTNAYAMAEIQKMFAEVEEGDYSAHIRAIRFAAENKVMLDEATKWAETAVEVSGGKYDALYYSASLLAAKGDYDTALKMGEKTLAAIPEGNERWVEYVKSNMAEWREKQ